MISVKKNNKIKLWRWWRFRLARTMYSVIIVKVYRLKLQRQTPSQKNINVNFRPLVSSDGYYYREILSVAYFFFLFDPLFPPHALHLYKSYVYYKVATPTPQPLSTPSPLSVRSDLVALYWADQNFGWHDFGKTWTINTFSALLTLRVFFFYFVSFSLSNKSPYVSLMFHIRYIMLLLCYNF